MATNPLYRNEFYFFSNMYDDSLITDFLRKISAESYERSILYQHNMLGRKRYRSDSEIFYKTNLEDFVIDEKYNRMVGIPTGSRTVKINTLVIPVHDKRKYIATYGLKTKKIPFTDFYVRKDIFDKCITLQIGKYRIMSAYLIENSDKTITLAIPNSNTDGMTYNHFNKLLSEYSGSEPVWIFSDEITQVYYADTTSAAAFSASALNGYYDVTINKSSSLNTVGSTVNHEHANSWDCLITYNTTTHGKKLFVTTPCTLKYSSATQLIFSVDEKFINMIKASNANVSIVFINRPNRQTILLYPYNDDTSPILNLNYNFNPVGNINIEVFEIDLLTKCKGRKLYDPKFTQMYFPNIFDFTSLNHNNSDLLIEITEYDPSYTNQIMKNSISPLIESLGSEVYTEYIVNDHDKSLDNKSLNLKAYHPMNYPISYSEYINSEYNGNFRGYLLDKVVKTIESDPYLMDSYYKWMLEKNKKVVTLSGTPKTLRFGTGKSGEFSGSNKIVNNTSFVSVNPDDIQYFSEPHSYITFHSSMDECPAIVYINGKYVRPTCTRLFKGMNYLFFPVSKINNEMSKYSSDKSLRDAAPITVDFYPNAVTSVTKTVNDVFTINSDSDIIKLFGNMDNPKFSIDELVLYDNTTGKYLGNLLDLFNVELIVSEYTINTISSTETIELNRDDMINYLLTSLGELYTTMDTIPIILSENDIKLNLNTFIDEMIAKGIITEDDKSVFTHKIINFKDIEITPKNTSLIGMSISVYSRSFKNEYKVNSSTGHYDSDKNVTTYTLSNDDFDIDTSRYFVFVDGCINPIRTLEKVDNKYNGTLSLTLNGDQTKANKEILIVHMPIGYSTDSFNTSSKVFFMKPAVAGEIETGNLWPDNDSDGIILQSSTGDIYNSLAFENDMNMKFTSSGLRLPPKSKSTNSLYRQYYNADRASATGLVNGDTGLIYFTRNDQPITNIAKQNPYSITYDENIVVNPLDILTYVEVE